MITYERKERVFTVILKIIDRTNVRPSQGFSGSSTFFTVEHFYDYGNTTFFLMLRLLTGDLLLSKNPIKKNFMHNIVLPVNAR